MAERELQSGERIEERVQQAGAGRAGPCAGSRRSRRQACAGCRLARNCAVARCHDDSLRVRMRPSSRDRSSAASAAARRSCVEDAGRAVAHHVDRARHRIGRDRRAARHRFQHHEAERVGAAREHEHVGLPVVPRECLAASSCRRTPRSGKRRCSSARAGPSPTTHFVPGRSSARNASMFFSTATRPAYRKIGRRTSGDPCGAGAEELGVDAARPHREVARSRARPAAAAMSAVAHHQRLAPAHGTSASSDSVTPTGSRVRAWTYSGKLRVVRGRERRARAQAVRARREPERSFGRDVHGVGREGLDRVAPRGGAGTATGGSPDRSGTESCGSPRGVSVATSWPSARELRGSCCAA